MSAVMDVKAIRKKFVAGLVHDELARISRMSSSIDEDIHRELARLGEIVSKPREEDQERRATLLLGEWGECQRRSASGIPAAPTESIESRMMRMHARRTKEDKSQAALRRATIREFEFQPGQFMSIIKMSPDGTQKQSKVTVERKTARWPAHIEALDRVLAANRGMTRIAVSTYVFQDSRREGAEKTGYSERVYRQKRENLLWYVIGAFAEIDAASY